MPSFTWNLETSDSGSVASGPAGGGAPAGGPSSTRVPGSAAVKPLRALKDRTVSSERGMFSC